jgi:hypothetical protein
MALGALPVRRGCGTRVAGGVYSECGLSPEGRPLEDFLLDPPAPLPLEAQRHLGITPIGVKLLPDPGDPQTHHVVDWVGSKHYPNVADFLEEVRRFGLSRRLPRTLDFARLSRASRHLVVHANAWIVNAADYFGARATDDWRCPRHRPDHLDPPAPPPMCASLWWEDVVGGEGHEAPDERLEGRRHPRPIRRAMPSFAYVARRPPAGVEGRYLPAVFAAFPITRLCVVADPEGGTHLDAVARARATRGVPVDLEEH